MTVGEHPAVVELLNSCNCSWYLMLHQYPAVDKPDPRIIIHLSLGWAINQEACYHPAQLLPSWLPIPFVTSAVAFPKWSGTATAPGSNPAIFSAENRNARSAQGSSPERVGPVDHPVVSQSGAISDDWLPLGTSLMTSISWKPLNYFFIWAIHCWPNWEDFLMTNTRCPLYRLMIVIWISLTDTGVTPRDYHQSGSWSSCGRYGSTEIQRWVSNVLLLGVKLVANGDHC